MEKFKNQLQENIVDVKKHLQDEYSQISVTGAHPSILNKIQVKYYGDSMSISKLANIVAQDFENLLVTPFDPEILLEMIKSISASQLNLNPIKEGQNSIRIHISPITNDKRKDLVKYAKKLLEEAKIKVRNVRQIANNKIKSNDDLSENEVKLYSEEMQKIISEANKELEKIFKTKSEEIMKV